MSEPKRVIALGFFDGIHRGHGALLEKTKEAAEGLNARPAVITFDTHPDGVTSDSAVELLSSPEDRAGLIRRLFKIEDIFFLHFDRKLMNTEWRQFLDYLCVSFGAVHFVAGYDFRFGKGGVGNTDCLRQYCAEHRLGCTVVDKVTENGRVISSTYIRELIKNGDISGANLLLGHPHTVTDTVRSGFRLGRTIGVPTINMEIPKNVIVPPLGVYAALAYLESGEVYRAVTNIGVRPTVSTGDAVSVESHLIGFSGDIYGAEVRIELFAFIRPERRFDCIDSLKRQINCDILTAGEILSEYSD